MLLNKFLVVAVLAAVCSAAVVEPMKKTSVVGVDEAVVRFMEENDFTTLQKMEVLRNMKRPIHTSINRDCEPEGGLYGGPGGVYFDDGCDLGKIIQVRVHASDFGGNIIITAIETVYEYGQTSHGLPGGNAPDSSPELIVDVASNEAIVAVVGNAGDTDNQYLNKLGFIVMADDGSTTLHGPVGVPYTGDNFIFCGEVQSFRGRSGWAIDSIGFNTD